MSARTRPHLLVAVTWSAVFLATAPAQERAKDRPAPLANAGLEDGAAGKPPPGWFFPPACREAGYTLTASEDRPFAGKRCAILAGRAAGPGVFGNVLQSVDAAGYRGRRVRFRAAVRPDVPGEGDRAMLWLRVDRPGGAAGFFDNMADRPIRDKAWRHYEIVGDVADDADRIVLGLMLLGGDTAALDDVSLEVIDKATARPTGESAARAVPAPGLAEVVMAHTVTAAGPESATLLYPLPLAYRDQVPVTFRLAVDPPAVAGAVEVVAGDGDNRILRLTLKDLKARGPVKVSYRSLVLVAPSKFDAVPRSAPFPKEWPAEARPWLPSTWCVDHENERVKALAREIRGDSDDVVAVVAAVLRRAQATFRAAKGQVADLSSVEALDKQGSCTSCANLVAALLRGAGVPARVVAGYPLWSGPLQTHYIVEAYVPGFGWYPVESTAGRAPWPNHQQVNVAVVPAGHESREKAGRRWNIAGGVPYLSLTECEDRDARVMAVGTLKPACDHECRMVRAMAAADGEWAAALGWARGRWAGWLGSRPALSGGRVEFGPDAAAVKAAVPGALRDELK